ncbi:MAG TPA: M28 family peptidase [Flavipsychrobacter sp.]|nr:M28 family peptidase [Flavipsychrobacter sp.]
MKNRILFIALSFAAATMFSCKDGDENTTGDAEQPSISKIDKPDFNADSAYVYIETQVGFGPRVPGTKGQVDCAAWLQQKLTDFCDTVFVQKVQVRAGDGKMLPCINLIGSINPKATRRVLLLAHWDTRPWADMDIKDKEKAILGADDGASGVGVLLEVARQIKSKPLSEDIGIDILFTDVEDYGKTEWGDNSYALGTQYWASNPHVPNYKAEFGILLDMVGGRNARFPLEGNSTKYAKDVQLNVWQAAGAAGFSSYFVYSQGAEITDDHVFVNEIARIPTIDIINLSTSSATSFAPHWHTHNDNMSVIDKNTLEAVGETLLQVIYSMVQPVT